MSTITSPTIQGTVVTASTPAGHGTDSNSHLSAQGVLRSEWVKLRSLRSSVTTLGAAGFLMALIGVLFSAVASGLLSPGGDPGPSEFAGNPAGVTLQGTMLAQLIIGVLGVMVITSEYATGTIRNTLTVVPKRLSVLWAKVAVTAAVTVPTMLAAVFIAFFAGQAILSSQGMATASLGDSGVLGAVVGTAGYLTGIALIGLALGTILRSTAVAISTLFGAVFLLPGLGGLLLPTSWKEHVLKYLPSNAGDAFTSVHHTAGTLSTGTGIAVFLAWVIVPIAVAAVLLKRRSV